ncbi:MAG: PKD domain-containing protein [Bacteroidota bacterium]
MPNPRICNRNDCDFEDVSLDFKAEGSNFFCEGEEAVVEIDQEASLDFDFFVYYWCDGVVDTLTFDDQPAKHRYTINPEDRCNNSQDDYFVQVIGVKECGEESTCRTVGVSLAIIYKPVAAFSAPEEACIDTEISFSDASCNTDEDQYLWDFGDGNTSTETNPTHTYESTGNYTVRLTVNNDCGGNSTSRLVRVVGAPEADFDFTINPENGCKPATVTFDGQTNEWSNLTWEIDPFDTLKWCFTEENMSLGSEDFSALFKQAGTYPVTLTASNVCPEDDVKTDTIEIFERPTFSINSPGTFCDPTSINAADLGLQFSGTIDKFVWTFENGSPNSFEGEDFPEVQFQQSGTITLAIESPCESMPPQTVPITIASFETINLGGNPTEICQNATPISLQATPTGGQWVTSGLPDGALTELGELDPSKLSPRNYTFTYSTGTAECPNEAQLELEILEGIAVSLDEVEVGCEKVTLNFANIANFQGVIDDYLWTFPDGTTSSEAIPSSRTVTEVGTFPLTIEVSGACGQNIADTIQIEVQANVNLAIEPINNPLCTGSTPDTLRVNTTGGQWRGNLITDAELGTYDPSAVAPGEYTIRYVLENGACSAQATTTIEVVASESVTISDRTVCTDSSPFSLEASTEGGIFTGIGVDSTNGIFDPTSVEPNDYTVSYSFVDGNGCAVEGKGTIVVEDFPQLAFQSPVELCVSNFDVDLREVTALNINPTGGNTLWMGEGIVDAQMGIFNAANLAEGTYKITLQYNRNECQIVDTLTVNLVQARPLLLSPDTTICIAEEMLQLTTNLAGGTWSGTGIDDAGNISLNEVGGGTFTYQYQFGIGTSCEQTGSVAVEIIDPASLIDAGADVEICEGPAQYTLQGASPADGLWEGTGITPTGTIDLTALKTDTFYTYTYCIESDQVASCGACATRQFRVNAKPVADFSLDGTACINQSFTLANNSSVADRFTWDFGDGNNSSEERPTYTYNQQGNYTISLVATTPFACKDTSTLEVFVTTPPTAAFTLTNDEGCAPFTVSVNNNSFGDGISQQWFVAGDTIDGPTLADAVIDSITNDSIFTIMLSVANSCGTVRDSANALVRPYPIVDFGISQDEDCSPAEIEFFNAVLGNPDSFVWNTGNGAMFSTFEPPNQIYTTSDTAISTYTIQLEASNECGTGRREKTVTVFPPDVEAFIELDTLSGCQPLTVELKGFATPGATTNWEVLDPMGNLMGSELDQTFMELTTPGVHTLIYFASNCGTHTDTAMVEVLPAPTVRFAHRPFICEGEILSFDNLSENIRGTNWDFGDGDTSTLFSPTHAYDSTGTYAIELTGFSENNNCPATFRSEVEVIGNPTAQFTPSTTSICPNMDVVFTNESAGQQPLIYNWDFGDGSSNSTEINPVHRFAQAGRYEVTLRVSDPDSCFSAVSVVDIFVNSQPLVEFRFVNQPYCHGYDTLFLENLSTNANQFVWMFDGDTTSLKDPFFVPKNAGTFPIELATENEFGCQGNTQQTVTILPTPIANFTLSQTEGCQPLAVQMDNESQNADGYIWNFDQEDASTDERPTHLFRNAGTIPVSLVATALNGCPADTMRTTIDIWEKPFADFSLQKTAVCGTPTKVIFDNLSPLNLDYQWSFGDGQQSSERTPRHLYDLSGEKVIALIVANELGCRDTAQQTVDIFGQPVADVLISTPVGCEDLTVTFSNLSESALTYEWSISGFPSNNAVSPTVTFTEVGSYNVELIAIYNEICTDTLRLANTVQVYQSPIADFSYEADLDKNVIGDVTFYNNSFNADRFQWDLGDGTTTTQTELAHVYDLNRSIPVSLVAFNDNGGRFVCTDSITKPIDPEWITTFFAPNAFAPDLAIDKVSVFQPVGIGIKSYSIDIYSPYGKLIWHSTALEDNQPTESWNGQLFNTGEPLPQGVYVWKAELVYVDGNEERKVGSVNLLR